MNDQTQRDIQATAEPIVEEAIARLANAGLTGPEIAQSLILTGAGLLAGSLGPQGAGHDLRAVAAKTSRWIEEIARATEAKSN